MKKSKVIEMIYDLESDAAECRLPDGDYVADRLHEIRCEVGRSEHGASAGSTKLIMHVADLLKETFELRAWKESMLQVEREWDEQKVGKLLGLTLGDPIRKNIEPKIRELKEDINHLNQMLRDTGAGQGEINAYCEQCEYVERLKVLLAKARSWVWCTKPGGWKLFREITDALSET